MANDRTVEITFELPASEVAVLDGWSQARQMKRGTALRQILREWSAKKHHEAIVICRVAGINPTASGMFPDQSGEPFGVESAQSPGRDLR